jgi:hypothetical protein
VSENLGKWIGLIFGIDQRSEAAKTKYPFLMYEDWHSNPKNRAKTTKVDLMHFEVYIVPSKLFDQPV